MVGIAIGSGGSGGSLVEMIKIENLERPTFSPAEYKQQIEPLVWGDGFGIYTTTTTNSKTGHNNDTIDGLYSRISTLEALLADKDKTVEELKKSVSLWVEEVGKLSKALQLAKATSQESAVIPENPIFAAIGHHTSGNIKPR